MSYRHSILQAAKQGLLLLIPILAACAPQPATQAPAPTEPPTVPPTEPPAALAEATLDLRQVSIQPVPYIAVSKLILPAMLSADENQLLVSNFRANQPQKIDAMNMTLVAKYQDLNTPLGRASWNWDAMAAAYTDVNNVRQVEVAAVPIRPEDPNAFSPEVLQTKIAAGLLPEMAVGGVQFLTDIEGTDVKQGEYLLVWYPNGQSGEVRLIDAQGKQFASSPVELSAITPLPLVELNQGSLKICVSFDSRKSCISIG